MLLTVMAFVLVGVVFGVGVLLLRLHTLPERLAHKSQKLQFEIVAVLGLLSLFTHNHAFWIAGLLLAFVDLPDFGTPLRRAAESLENIAARAKETPIEVAQPLSQIAVSLQRIAEAPRQDAENAGKPLLIADALEKSEIVAPTEDRPASGPSRPDRRAEA